MIFCRKFLILLIALVLIKGGTINGQKKEIKLKELKEVKDNYQKVNILFDLGILTVNTQPDSSVKFADEILKLSTDIHYEEGIGKGYYLLGTADYKKENYDASLNNFIAAINIFKKLNSLTLLGKAYYFSGLNEYNLGNYNNVKNILSKARDVALSVKDDTLYAKSTLWMGITLSVIGDLKDALNYHYETIKAAEKIGRKDLEASATLEIGITYSTLNNSDKAIEYYLNAQKLYEEAGDKINLSVALTNLSEEYVKIGKFKEAAQITRKALNIAFQTGDNIEIGAQQSNFCKIYTSLKQIDKAKEYGASAIRSFLKTKEKKRLIIAYINYGNLFLAKNNPQEAIIYFTDALKIAQKFNTAEDLISCYSNLSLAYEADKNYPLSLKYYKLSSALSDSVYNKQYSQQILEMQTKYETEKKEKENELLKKDMEIKHHIIAKQDTIIFLISFVLVVVAVLVFILVRLNIQKRKMNKQLTLKKEESDKYAEQLAESNITKDKFFSIIAHDLKNPFHSLMSVSSLLKGNYSEIDPESLQKFLDEIYKTSKNGYTLLENLLQWSKNQTGSIEFNPEIQFLKEVIDHSVTMLEGLAREKEIEITVKVDSQMTITADRNMMETVFRNLLHNAIKFTGDKGKIFIESNINNGFVNIEVKDSGIGISEDNMKKLFQLDKVYSTRGTHHEKGSGLGLLLCKEFIEKHGGTIKVRSEIGNGSSFVISLTINKA